MCDSCFLVDTRNRACTESITVSLYSLISLSLTYQNMYITYFVDPFLWVAIPRYPELSPALTAFVNLRVQLERTFLSSFTPLVTYTPFLATKSRAVIVLNSANETKSPGFGQSMYCAHFVSVYWLLIAIF